jgi:hypothetical protein
MKGLEPSTPDPQTEQTMQSEAPAQARSWSSPRFAVPRLPPPDLPRSDSRRQSRPTLPEQLYEVEGRPSESSLRYAMTSHRHHPRDQLLCGVPEGVAVARDAAECTQNHFPNAIASAAAPPGGAGAAPLTTIKPDRSARKAPRPGGPGSGAGPARLDRTARTSATRPNAAQSVDPREPGYVCRPGTHSPDRHICCAARPASGAGRAMPTMSARAPPCTAGVRYHRRKLTNPGAGTTLGSRVVTRLEPIDRGETI